MDKTITIRLTGHPEEFRLDEGAYDRLERYLDRAAGRLQDDPDRAEVLGDLERSVGDKLAASVGTSGRLVDGRGHRRASSKRSGPSTQAGSRPRDGGPSAQPRPRRLRRIREGQQIAGVCNGLADYAELDVAWVRSGFLFGVRPDRGFFVRRLHRPGVHPAGRARRERPSARGSSRFPPGSSLARSVDDRA